MSRLSPSRLALAALALTAAAASPAGAASYEQISRASGTAGATTLGFRSVPLFASDTGLTGAFTTQPDPASFFPPLGTGLRNTITNKTRAVRPEAGQLIGIDRTETIGLFYKIEYPAYETVYRVGSLSGAGTAREVARFAGPADQHAVQLAGDGRSVVVANGTDTRRIVLATGASSVLSATSLGLAPRYGVSDDGAVVGGAAQDPDTGEVSNLVIASGKARPVAGWPFIAPDGKTASWLGGPTAAQPSPALYTLTLATGKTTSVALPAVVTDQFLIEWIAPDGSKVAVADTGVGEPVRYDLPAQVLDRPSRTWAPFGGPYANWIKSGVSRTAVSRNGRFAAVAFNGQVALANLAGRPILGNLFGLEAVSASSYLQTQYGFFQGCGDFAFAAGTFVRPAAWLPTPKRAEITFSADGKPIKTVTLTKVESAPGADDGDGALVSFPPGTQTGTVKLSVVDGAGRTVTETYSRALACPDIG